MGKVPIILVVVDDDVRIKDEDAFIDEANDTFERVEFFSNSNDAIKFIEENVNQKMIVILDLGFTHNMLDGHQTLEKIRTLSLLIPVIIWSGRDEDKETFADLIDNRAYAFIKKSASTQEMMDVVMKAYEDMQSNIDNVIEGWLQNHVQKDIDKPFMVSSSGESYTLEEVLKEIRLQTDFGKEITKNINKLTIDLLMRNKEKLQ